MLSDPERRTLHDMEHRLLAEDPVWADLFSSQQRKLTGATRPAWRHYTLMAGATLAAVLAVVMLLAGIPSLAAFFLLTTTVSIWLLNDPPPRPRRGTGGGTGRRT